jgi:hypothetical protein
MRLRCSDYSKSPKVPRGLGGMWDCTVKWLYRNMIVLWRDRTVKWMYLEVIVLRSECTVKWFTVENCTVTWLYCEVIVPWSDCTLKWLFCEGLYCEVTACPASQPCSFSPIGFNSGGFFHIWSLLCLHSVEYYRRCHALRVSCAAVCVGMVALLGQMNFFGCGCTSLWRVGGCPVTGLSAIACAVLHTSYWLRSGSRLIELLLTAEMVC